MPRSPSDPVRAAETKRLRREAGRWLKSLRESAGLTQAELAERVGLRYYTFISQVESGLGRVPVETQGSWAEAVGADLHEGRVRDRDPLDGREEEEQVDVATGAVGAVLRHQVAAALGRDVAHEERLRVRAGSVDLAGRVLDHRDHARETPVAVRGRLPLEALALLRELDRVGEEARVRQADRAVEPRRDRRRRPRIRRPDRAGRRQAAGCLP